VTRFLRPTFLTLSLLATLAAPAVADAQRRVAVPRSAGNTNVIVGARHYSPASFYRPYYYGPYYRSFYPYYPYSSFAFSFGYGWGYPSYGFGYGGYPYYGYGYGYPYYGPGFYDSSSSVRLQVMPKESEVYVDGYFAGNVDNFDGTFQRLRLAPGDHEIQLFMPGHRSFSQRVYLQPGGSFRVQHAMEPLGAGETEPTRPVAAPRSSQNRPEPYGGAIRPNSRGPQRPSPRASERAGNAESEFGAIALRVQPGDAAITIDGEPWQGAQDQDRLEVQLGPGTHTVEIRKDGYRTYITDITVRPGETTPLNVSLTRQ